ncbi:MAG TPA: PD-(D/E)XK nuclease domain-containing protein, partial [Candidatus Cryptobacteroides intestinipullorum]|nr:PD-(D/E)XK nuclease domain-containing protein [Candidatus Cryptobacteroides intestinipullorum]
SADEALKQIDSKGYLVPYRTDGRKVVKVGVNFDSATRTVRNWKAVWQ